MLFSHGWSATSQGLLCSAVSWVMRMPNGVSDLKPWLDCSNFLLKSCSNVSSSFLPSLLMRCGSSVTFSSPFWTWNQSRNRNSLSSGLLPFDLGLCKKRCGRQAWQCGRHQAGAEEFASCECHRVTSVEPFCKWFASAVEAGLSAIAGVHLFIRVGMCDGR